MLFQYGRLSSANSVNAVTPLVQEWEENFARIMETAIVTSANATKDGPVKIAAARTKPRIASQTQIQMKFAPAMAFASAINAFVTKPKVILDSSATSALFR